MNVLGTLCLSIRLNPKSRMQTSSQIISSASSTLQKSTFEHELNLQMGKNDVDKIKVIDAVDSFLNMSNNSSKFDKLELGKLSRDEVAEFGKMLNKLAKKGIVGYNYYEVDGQIEKHFIDANLNNKRLNSYNAKILEERKINLVA